MIKGKLSKKIWLSIVAIFLLLGLTACLGNDATIKPDTSDFYFEFGKKMNLPDTTVFNSAGEPVAYDSVCIAMTAPDGSDIDISSGFVTPMQVGTYVLTYESASQNTKAEINVECKDTIAPTLNMIVPEAYLIKETYEDTEHTVFTLPIISADDLAGIDIDRTVVTIVVGDTEIALNGDKFMIPTEGKLVFTVTVYDMNGLCTTITRESIATAPEHFEEFCLSSFATESYLAKLCGGWLASWYSVSVLESDTDPAGNTMEGVLKITYDVSDSEAGACIHLARPVKREDIGTIKVTLRVENGSIAAGNMNAVFYPARWQNGYWATSNLPILNDGNYAVYSLPSRLLDKMTGEDGYIRELQIETFGNKSVARSLYIADISYTPAEAGSGDPSVPSEPGETTVLEFNELGAGGNNAQFINVNVTNSLPDYTILTDDCNEETHILIDGVAWTSGAEIKTGGPKTLVFKGMNASAGTTMTILKGFSVTFGNITCVTEREYVYQWNGTVWVLQATTEPSEPGETGVFEITEIGNGSNNALFFNLNVTNGLPDYTIITDKCNEETHVLIDDTAWTNGAEIKTAGSKTIVFKGINASAGTKMTILKGFSVTFGDETYVTDREYVYLWDGAVWTLQETTKPSEPGKTSALEIIELGVGSNNAQFFNVNVANNLPDFTILTDKCNEETHVLIGGEAWTSGAEIKTGGPKTLVFKGMNASVGTKLTILEGFSVTFGDKTYVTEQEYIYQWDGTAWVLQETAEA